MIDTNSINKVVDSGSSEVSAEDLLLEQNNAKIHCRYFDLTNHLINNLQRDMIIYH